MAEGKVTLHITFLKKKRVVYATCALLRMTAWLQTDPSMYSLILHTAVLAAWTVRQAL